MASEADRVPPAADTEVVDLADQPTQSDEE
jgi:hypothetical protein